MRIGGTMRKLWRKFKFLLENPETLLRPLAIYALLFYSIPPIGGGGGSSKKESERAADIARQERMRAEEQAAALRQQQEAAAAQLMAEIQAVTAPTGLERTTQQQISGLQPDVEAMLRQAAAGQAPPVSTPLALALQERLLGDLTRNVDDTFAPNLELLKGEVGNFAARRGIVGSGLELEQLGRTGVELAIQQAQAREQIRAQDVERALQGNQSLETIGAQRRGELSGFLTNLQALEDARRAREVGAVSGGAQQGAQIRSQGNLTALERLNQGDSRALGVEQSQLEADRAARASQQKGIANLLGTVAGVGTALIPGVGPLLSPLVMAGLSGGPISISQQPTVPTAASLRAAQRQPSGLRGGFGEFADRFGGF